MLVLPACVEERRLPALVPCAQLLPLGSLRVVKERGVKTSRGVEVGAHADQVTRAYPSYVRRGSHAIVISDPLTHRKLRFLLEGGEVYEISLYHAPGHREVKRTTIKRRRRRVLFGQ